MARQKYLTIDELLAVGQNQSWDQEPFWDPSLRFHLPRLGKAKKIKIVGLFAGAMLILMSLVGLFSALVNWMAGRADFSLVVPLLLVLALFVFQTGNLWAQINKINDLRDHLLRVGINHDVYMYQKQKARHDPPPYSC